MSIRRKLILMGICAGIIIIVLTVNVVKRIQDDKTSGNVIVKENVITRAEAYRLLSYLKYDKSSREAIGSSITYSNKKWSGWYDSYMNAVYKMGLIDSDVTTNPNEALTYGNCKELIDKLILSNPGFQKAYTGLSFTFTDAKKDMLIKDFLELYKALLALVPEKDRIVSESAMLVLGRDNKEEGVDRIITSQGRYYYRNAISYEENAKVKTTDDPGSFINQYVDKGIKALVSKEEMVYVSSVTSEQIIVHNVWIEQGKDLKVDTFIEGIHKSIDAISKLSSPIEKVVGDITIENNKIVKINVKPDMIQGKVLQSGKNYIDVEGYGKVPLDENFKIYKIYGEISMETTANILVGYNNTDFIVSGGKICTALITESIKAKDIRVLLKTTGYKGILHEYVEFTATSDFTVSTKGKKQSYKKGDKVTIKPGNELFKDGRITVKTDSEEAKIKILSMKRAYGNPAYRGTLEIAEEDNKLILVNELPLEEYLYAVIPSEMPTSYGIEALKVQAVCARSYAYRHLLANSLSQYGAHVDDSSYYQVYNNIAENEDSVLAVKDTYGEVIKYNNDVIVAYYYSTSCGHTADPASVWSNGVKLPYLSGKLILTEEKGEAAQAQSKAEKKYEDLSSEKTFKSFIQSNNISTYDSSFSWYRWNVTMNLKDIKKVIDSNLASKYKASPNMILTKVKKGKKTKYESIPVDTVGNIVDISVLKRESSGIITELLIKGSKNTIKVCKEYNIRALLAPTYDSLNRQDGSKIENLGMLPSAFCMVEKVKKKGKLTGFKITGGGYGHGVGMSQNAVKSLADSGKDYKDIVQYFYKGTQMGIIYK